MKTGKNKKYALLGIPDDSGVAAVGGRMGAATGPKSFRELFCRLKDRNNLIDSVDDLGDVADLGNDARVNHSLAAEKIAMAHSAYRTSIIVGGGHDHGYSHLSGLVQAGASKIGCINLDAHFDLRKPEPVISSGSPFWLALESGILAPENLVEFGIQEHCNSASLWNYAESKKIKTHLLRDLRLKNSIKIFSNSLEDLSSRCDQIAISFDLDCVAAAFAPGVSAPQVDGFTPSEISEFMILAGRQKKVVSLGIFELNPLHDVSDLTSRLASTSAFHFLNSRSS